ncbi:MAG: family 10 glycosylhydrolase [Lentisphaerae bacterium]|jgi:hypothetical protein|nr:family 10 glycosylhydrolase [Lentisphaerota bacterium]MBT7060939.1 family 10 glycosylhydrolase [Lentisphaerota bacterium]
MERYVKDQSALLASARLALAAAAALAATLFETGAQPTTREVTVMKAARREAARRQRRIMYNDDGCHPRPYTSPDEFLGLRLKQLLGTQVDTICYCTGGSGVFWGHIPETGELIGEYVGKADAAYVKDICKGIAALRKLGTDPLTLAVEFGHTNGMEVFWSCRMNNVEDSFAAWCHPRWKREHPEYLLGSREDWDKYAYTDPRKWWAALNFEIPEVRAQILSIFEDVCGRYDVDGVEMDFFRHPRFFPPTTDGLPVAPEQVAAMTDLVRSIRAATENAAHRRNRPLLISCRVPLSVERAYAIGLDLETWLRDDLVDILVIGGDLGPMAMAPQLRTMVELAHRHGARAHANIGGSGMQKRQGYVEPEAWWAAATNAWHAGVDGIYTFNLFPTEPNERFSILGAPEELRGLNKLYAIDPIEPKNLWGFNRSALVIPDRLPLVFGPSGRITAILPVGEDIVANAPAGKAPEARLGLRTAGLVDGDSIVVRLNGLPPVIAEARTPLTDRSRASWFDVPVDPAAVRAGDNRIGLAVASKRALDTSALLDRLELHVDYH